MEESQPGSATTGSTGMGTGDTNLTERVEPSFLVQRVTACLSISAVKKHGACFGDAWTATQCSHVFVVEPDTVERDTTSQKEEAEQLEVEAWLISETSGSGEKMSGVKYLSVQVVRLKQWY